MFSTRRSTPKRRRPFWHRIFPFIFLALAAFTGWVIVRELYFRPPLPPVEVQASARLPVYETVRAEAGGRTLTEGPARIDLETGAELRIRRDTAGPAQEIELKRGSIRVRVTPIPGGRFLVRTPNATVGVRGTTFRVSVLGLAITRVVVEEGNVYVLGQTGDTLSLGPGMGGEVSGSGSASSFDPTFSDSRPFDVRWNTETLRRIADLAEALALTENGRTAAPSRSSSSGTPTSPGAPSVTDRNRLAGVGDWTADNGLTGQITMVIEPISGRFNATFSGQRGGERPMSVEGRGQGQFTGDADNGSLDGTFTAQAAPAGAGGALPPIQGQATGVLRNHVVTGTLAAGPWRGNYEIRLR